MAKPLFKAVLSVKPNNTKKNPSKQQQNRILCLYHYIQANPSTLQLAWETGNTNLYMLPHMRCYDICYNMMLKYIKLDTPL